MIVIDASALLDLILDLPAAHAVEEAIAESAQELHAPHLLDIEVAQAVRRLTAMRLIDAERGRAAMADLADFPVERHPHVYLLPVIWILRNNFTAYDAAYVALAQLLGASLLTRDRRLASAARRYTRVEIARESD